MTRVTFYGADKSEWSVKARDFLKENGVRFDEIDLVKNPDRIKEMEDKTGQRGVPVIDIDGVIIVGFDEQKLIHALHL